jgi:hypothetical protein
VPPPEKPLDIPPEAFAALASLREVFQELLPEGADFGIGLKQTGGDFLDQLALIVFVPEKLPVDSVPPGQLIPSVWEEEGIKLLTDVVQSNPILIALLNDTGFYNPLRGGIEIGTFDLIAGLAHMHTGTLGCVIQRRSDGSRLLLTCAHVAAAAHDVSQPQQGSLGSSVIGTVVQAIPHDAPPWTDCAAVEPNGTRGAPQPTVRDIGPVKGSAAIKAWDVAKKRGRTTGFTTGVVVAVVPDTSTFAIDRMLISTFPPGGLYCFRGDSGSAVLNANDEVVGLLFAMDDDRYDANNQPIASTGWARAIQLVLDGLDVEVAVSPPVVTQVQPNTALGVLANGGWTQLDGWGFDAGSQVSFGGLSALSIVPASPRRLIVTPPVQFIPGQEVDVLVTNGLGEQSLPSIEARFTY